MKINHMYSIYVQCSTSREGTIHYSLTCNNDSHDQYPKNEWMGEAIGHVICTWRQWQIIEKLLVD